MVVSFLDIGTDLAEHPFINLGTSQGIITYAVESEIVEKISRENRGCEVCFW